MEDRIHIRAEILDEMLCHARIDQGIECCGLLAGRGTVITTMFPTRNALASATAYEIDSTELFLLFRRMREEGLDHLGLYHSHPAGENIPSLRDVEQSFYPAQAYFIVSPRVDAPIPIRAFSIRDAVVREFEIVPVKS